jgi:ascorbate-specific PTS system EIIC-type component UlaA
MKKFLKNLIEDRWTLAGMFIAWAVLEGQLKTIVGYLLLGSLIVGAIYLVTKKDEED